MRYMVSKRQHVYFEEQTLRNRELLEIRCDTVDDLPTMEDEPAMLPWSIAMVVQESAFYVLDGGGVWRKWVV